MDEQEPDSIYAVDLPKVKAVCLILSHRAAGGVFCGVSPRAVCRCWPGRAGLCQKLVRSLLESYIQNEDGYQLAVSIPGAAEAPILCDTEDIDLVLMDVQTEHRENGLAAAKKIRETHPEIKIVVATSLIDTQVLARAKAVGADSLWYKDGDEGTLMQVVRRTMVGEHIFPDAPPSVEIGTAMSAEFTKGEMKVLRCLVRGLSYNEIAKELGIEPSTVKYHVINMLQKTNLENKLQLAIAATEAKLVVELAEE